MSAKNFKIVIFAILGLGALLIGGAYLKRRLDIAMAALKMQTDKAKAQAQEPIPPVGVGSPDEAPVIVSKEMEKLLWMVNAESKATDNQRNSSYRCTVCNNIMDMGKKDVFALTEAYEAWYGETLSLAVSRFPDAGGCSWWNKLSCPHCDIQPVLVKINSVIEID